MCYLVGKSSFHKTDADPNLAPVLNLKPFSKCLRVSSSRPAVTCLGPVNLQGWVLGVIRMRPVKFIKLNRLRFGHVGGRFWIGMMVPVGSTQKKMVLA